MRKSVSSLGWVHWILAHKGFELYHSDMQGLERDEMKHRGKLAPCQEIWLKLGLCAHRKQWQRGHESVAQVQAHLGATRAHARPVTGMASSTGSPFYLLLRGTSYNVYTYLICPTFTFTFLMDSILSPAALPLIPITVPSEALRHRPRGPEEPLLQHPGPDCSVPLSDQLLKSVTVTLVYIWSNSSMQTDSACLQLVGI